MQSAQVLFEAELQKRNLRFERLESGFEYLVQSSTGELNISLGNIIRNYERDGDSGAVLRFAEQILSPATFVRPQWNTAKSLLYFSAEPSNQQFGDTLRWDVTEEVCKVLVVTDLQEGKITWVTPSSLQEWQVSEQDALDAAAANLDALLKDKEPELADPIDGMHLAMIPIDSVLKTSIIFAPGFKKFVTRKLQWPILAVIPCRDFIYILSEKDKALLNRMGVVVQREFRNSGYPTTTEVLCISDDGIEAIGKFPE